MLGNRENLVLTGFAGRLERATSNSLLALALVSPAVLITHVSEPVSNFPNQIMLIFVIARIAYTAMYALGIVWLRTVAWLTAFTCTALLYVGLVL
ncbi:MAG: MAPEG family protein [Rhodobacterales bacterium]